MEITFQQKIIRSDPARGSDGTGNGTADSSGDDDGSDEDDEDEDGGDYVYIKNAEVSEGFNSVVMADPPGLYSKRSHWQPLHHALLWRSRVGAWKSIKDE